MGTPKWEKRKLETSYQFKPYACAESCLNLYLIIMIFKLNVALELFQFVYSAYQSPSSLFCGDNVLQSEEGVQQGDPLGPLLFCLTTHPLVTKLTSEFKIFYRDDGTLVGSAEFVLHDLQLVEREAAELGLQLNCSKSELICCQPVTPRLGTPSFQKPLVYSSQVVTKQCYSGLLWGGWRVSATRSRRKLTSWS